MGMTQIEDIAGNTAEVNDLGETVELTTTVQAWDAEEICVSLVLTPRQARALALQLLEQADATEYGE
jgi:hypothetical protein